MKILLFLVAVFVLLWLLRGATTRRRRGGAAPPPQAPQEMIACAHCGVHLPRDELHPGILPALREQQHRRRVAGERPVRERVQRFANRVVYGARATPYEVLSDFATRMGGTYASAELLPQMARTVAEGVGAATVDVWLKLGTTLVREATWPPTTARPTAAQNAG